MTESNWKVYRRSKDIHDNTIISDDIIDKWLENCPPWRRQNDVKECDRSTPKMKNELRGSTYVLGAEDVLEDKINLALWLRKPLLVTGAPGIGKTSLAYHLAWKLGLGEPLRWEINSRTTLVDGLYSYDAVGHLRDNSPNLLNNPPVNLRLLRGRRIASYKGSNLSDSSHDREIGEYITLGPLCTSFLPTKRPRVLIVDELDKANFDLPNDLLHIFEEGAYKIPELVRSETQQRVVPFDARNSNDRVLIQEGEIRTKHHPIVVITSNEERDFSSAFLRRCVQLKLEYPSSEQLTDLVAKHLEIESTEELRDLCDQLAKEIEPTDAIINGIFLHKCCNLPFDKVLETLGVGV